nr:putative transposase En/Spm [Ipomoea batatas]
MQKTKSLRSSMQERNFEAQGKKIALPQSEDLILQPPSVVILEEDHMQIRMIPMPLKLVWPELHDTDSERTISTSPTTSNSHMVRPSTSSSGQSSHNKTFIHPIDNTIFEPCSVHRNIMPCIKRIFPEAIKTFKTAPQHLKDVWFNEFKVKHATFGIIF